MTERVSAVTDEYSSYEQGDCGVEHFCEVLEGQELEGSGVRSENKIIGSASFNAWIANSRFDFKWLSHYRFNLFFIC